MSATILEGHIYRAYATIRRPRCRDCRHADEAAIIPATSPSRRPSRRSRRARARATAMPRWKSAAAGGPRSRPTSPPSSASRPASSWPRPTPTASPTSSIAAARPASCTCSTTSTIAFADFSGNRQYITSGNLADNPKAHLFLIDYANRRRVKIWGEAQVVEGDAELLAQADAGRLQGARPEQVILFTVIGLGFELPRSTSRSASRPPTSPRRWPRATSASPSWRPRSRG